MEAEQALGTFAYHGIDLSTVNGSRQIEADCPFCSKERHLFISSKKENAGQFNCKHCGVTGNRFTFLQLYHEHHLEQTGDKEYKELAKHPRRKTRYWQAFKQESMAWDSMQDRWLLPIYNDAGSLVDLQTWNPAEKPKPRLHHTKGCTQHIEGLDTLISDGPIFICEGSWKKAILTHVFPQVDERENYSIISVPGCQSYGVFRKDAKLHFTNRDVVLLFDSGKSAADGQDRTATLLSREYHARSIQCIHWPDSYPDNYGIDDLINKKGPKEAWTLIQSYLRPWTDPNVTAAVMKHGGKIKSIEDVITAFRKSGILVNREFADAIKVAYAAVISIKMGGRPLWLFLIGPAGSGKSLILESTLASSLCIYQADLKYESFVSGFKSDEDPSLLARLGNRSLVVKDYTTILTKAAQQQHDLLSCLRELFDGKWYRNYGNGVVREYPPPESGMPFWYFSFVAGTTPSIHNPKHLTAALGDAQRVLKWEMRPALRSLELIRRARHNAREDYLASQKAADRQAAVAAFIDSLQVSPTSAPSIAAKWEEQMDYLVLFVENCRAAMERDRQTGDLFSDPDTALGTRLSEQLTKLAQALAIVCGRKGVDSEVFRLVRQAAWYTSYGWRRAVWKALWQLRESPVTAPVIARKARMSLSGTKRVLLDLRDLGIIHVQGTEATKGRPADLWQFTKYGLEISTRSKIFI